MTSPRPRRAVAVLSLLGLAAPLAFAACGGEPPPQPEAPRPLPVPAPETIPSSSTTATAAAPPRTAPRADATLTPRVVFSGNPDYAGVRLSPNGKHLSWLAPSAGVLNVWVAPADDPSKAVVITASKDRGIRRYHWTYDDAHVLYVMDTKGDENFHVHIVDVKTREDRDLTPLPKVRAEIEGISAKRPKEIVVGLNDRDEKHHDLNLIDLATGKRTLLEKNEAGYAEYVLDLDYKVKVATKELPDGGRELEKKDAKGSWVSFLKVGLEDAMNTQAWTVDKSGGTLFLADSRARDTSAFFAVDLANGKGRLMAEDPKADIGTWILHPKERKVMAVGFEYERKAWKVLDKTLEPDLAYLKTVAKGDLSVPSTTHDFTKWIVSDERDDGPTSYYVYDRAKKQAKLLFVDRKVLEKVPLAKMHARIVKSRDGLDLVSFLTLPKASDPDGDGKPSSALPMVLLVHGGPWSRDKWGYHPWHQWLASRGYAVLGVNFRGSTGFGKKYLNAGNMEWAGKMHDDLVDAVDWAVKSGVAQKDKVAIYGGSYGGYSTLVGLTFTPDTFACGIDLVGPSNLVTLLSTIPPYWQPMIETFAKRVGDHRTDEGKKQLLTRSPISFVEKIKRPLLIGQGANDPRVKQAESDQIVKAMKDKGIPVTYVLYSDEGHGFNRPENRLSFDAVAETFLAQCLGGAYLPVGEDFKGSTIAVPAGAEHIEGLPKALASK